MPTYTFYCNKCNIMFETFSTISNYTDKPYCIECDNNEHTLRMYDVDFRTQSTSVKKSDSELKTIGDLARRNSDRMSEDEKIHLYQKHNEYKFEKSDKPLPKGMNRIKKPEKTKWPGTSEKKRKRKPTNG